MMEDLWGKHRDETLIKTISTALRNPIVFDNKKFIGGYNETVKYINSIELDEKEKFKAVVDKISDGIAICSPDYLIKDSNAAILKYLNISEPSNVNFVETLYANYAVSINKETLFYLNKQKY
jgi:PAS domain-containing protein